LAAWDSCIAEAFNGIAYAYSWYLNAVYEHWDALVAGDYEYVMPLTWRKKYGISYIFQSFLSQQHGIFTKQLLNKAIKQAFIDSIPKKFKYIEMSLNQFNLIEPEGFTHRLRTTYELDLNLPYQKLYDNFKKSTQKNVRRTKNKNIAVNQSISIEQFIQFYKDSTLKDKNIFTTDGFKTIRRLISAAISHRSGIMLASYTEKNELCGIAFFVKTHNKAILLLSALNETGRKDKAMYAIINQFIIDHSRMNITLDFEGSEIEEIAYFNEGFGAIPCKYQYIKANRLPYPLNLLKK